MSPRGCVQRSVTRKGSKWLRMALINSDRPLGAELATLNSDDRFGAGF
jgi:hypothetical protein